MNSMCVLAILLGLRWWFVHSHVTKVVFGSMAPNVCCRKCMWNMRYFNIVHYCKVIYNRHIVYMLYIHNETMEKMMRRTHVNLATKQCCYLCCQLCYVAYNGDYSWDKYLRLIVVEWSYWINWWCTVSVFFIVLKTLTEVVH